MKQLLAFIRKEFYHVFRDRRTLLILFGLPIVQIILFGYALSSEVKNIGIAIHDNAHDVHSQQIINKIKTSSYFQVKEPVINYMDIENRFKDGSVKCAVIFPAKFGTDLYRIGGAQIQIIADASDPNTATIVTNYLKAIISNYQQVLNPNTKLSYQIVPQLRQLYNEEQNGSLNFIPGVIALIFMIVSTALTSVAIVREKELGTLEILLVSPFKPVMVLIAKAIPYLVLSLINFIIILLLSVFLLHVEIRGSLLLINKRKPAFDICRKHFIYYHLSFFGLAYFKCYRLSTNSNVAVNDGNDVANNAADGIYVSSGKYALDIPRDFARYTIKVLL
jgi:ABC-2 type transport system permease protein